mmetsp:Transcript_10921/g.21716  ORF Transcript_10921/g.21716 Transcript_10921/m.21716 type:complete len:89 (+) Transcript_10921:101-367(+)
MRTSNTTITSGLLICPRPISILSSNPDEIEPQQTSIPTPLLLFPLSFHTTTSTPPLRLHTSLHTSNLLKRRSIPQQIRQRNKPHSTPP